MEKLNKISWEDFEKLKQLSIFKANVATDSMSPVIKAGDHIVVDVGQMNLKRFDIIVFYFDETLICHYLWRLNKIVSPIYLQTKSLVGLIDYPIPIENYLGKVISHDLGFLRKMRLFID